MTTVAIMQPMYLPWKGFFELIAACDVFIHLDDVLIPRGRSFTNRVQAKTKDGIKWLTVPLSRQERTTIEKTMVDTKQQWQRKHLLLLEQAYARAPYKSSMLELTAAHLGGTQVALGELNIRFIEQAAGILGLAPTILRSSALDVASTGSKRILDLVRAAGGTTYVTGHGGRNYLDHQAFEDDGIQVRYMDYSADEYPQLHGEFTPYVTVLDLLANTGDNARDWIVPSTVTWQEYTHG